MIESEKKKYLKVIMCQTEWNRKELEMVCQQMANHAEERLLKSLYQNGHTVLSVRTGQSRCEGRKSMIFVEAQDLNGKYLTYRADFYGHGKTIEILREIKKGWQSVATW